MNNNKFTIDFNPTDANFIIDLRTNLPLTPTLSRGAREVNKLAIIGIVSLILITTSAFYVHAQVGADISTNNPILAQDNIVQDVANSVKMTATVPGWFKTAQISNERLDITTNMEVFVNGQEVAPINQITKNANPGADLRF